MVAGRIFLTADDKLSALGQQVRSSDRDAFRTLFEETYPGLQRYATSLLGDPDAAKDVVQEVFLRIWKRRETLDPGRSVKSLLYTAVRNLSFNEDRTATSRKILLTTIEKPDLVPDASEGMGAKMLGKKFQEWIREMPDKRREAFQLSRFDGLSYAEIARLMGLSVRTVERHIQLALRHLRDRLKEYEPDLLQS